MVVWWLIFSTSSALSSPHTHMWLVPYFHSLLIIVLCSLSPLRLFLSPPAAVRALKKLESDSLHFYPLNPVVCSALDLASFCFDRNAWTLWCAMWISCYKVISSCKSSFCVFIKRHKKILIPTRKTGWNNWMVKSITVLVLLQHKGRTKSVLRDVTQVNKWTDRRYFTGSANILVLRDAFWLFGHFQKMRKCCF